MPWTDTAGTLAPSVGKFHFSTRKPRMLRLNSNPFFRTLSVCGPPSGEMEVIHSAETHHPNPISSLPQQEIITSIKAVRTGGKGPLSETLLQALEISTERRDFCWENSS